QINSKGFQGVFSIFFYTKKMLAKFTNIKKYRAIRQWPVHCVILFLLEKLFIFFVITTFLVESLIT
ncbi:MAG TPA: hypothetical protein DEP40_09820, partial [Enterococcus sp.]|nr:hypothetical protein [Enterococcus sp.]